MVAGDFEEPFDGQGFVAEPRAVPRRLFSVQEWRAAQADLSTELADVVQRMGTLDERLRRAGPGALQRLALMEAGDLGWWAGDRVPADRLALWTAQHGQGGQDDALALARLSWAVRRLGQGPDAGAEAETAAQFLERRMGQAEALDGLDWRLADLAAVMAAASGLHQVTQACILFHAWRMLGAGQSGDIEAAVMAARHGGRGRGRGSADVRFLPQAMAGAEGLRARGSALSRLAGWLRGAEQATLVALRHLERQTLWQARAAAALADQSGRTPKALIGVLATWPLVTTALAIGQSGCSRAAVQRGLDVMQTRHLIREVTGQGRYRIWTATL